MKWKSRITNTLLRVRIALARRGTDHFHNVILAQPRQPRKNEVTTKTKSVNATERKRQPAQESKQPKACYAKNMYADEVPESHESRLSSVSSRATSWENDSNWWSSRSSSHWSTGGRSGTRRNFSFIIFSPARDGDLHVRDGRCKHYTTVTAHLHAMFHRTFCSRRFDGCFAHKKEPHTNSDWLLCRSSPHRRPLFG